ncbi:MAG: sulfurtransferase FdhD, partial [Terrabacter sp.]|nr:sulfurtransferase FdhD [Terrabacter sp.]
MTTERARRPGPSVRTRVVEHTDGDAVAREDRLITEEPLEIRVRSTASAPRRAWVTMRTPGHDFELAAGWLVNEGLVAPTSITRVAYCTDADLAPEQEFNVVTVDVSDAVALPHRHETTSAGSSACGVCGKDSVVEALATRTSRAWAGPLPDASVVRRLPEALRER